MADLRKITLRLDLLSPWICGSGRGAGKLHDAVGVRDDDGLPYIPGRHLKGLLRDALERAPARAYGGDTANGDEVASFLFGPKATSEERDLAANYFFGLLRVSSARLSDADRSAALLHGEAEREATLFMTAQSTAIDPILGVARDKTLRSTQLAIPMTLYAEIEADKSAFRFLQEPHGYERALLAGQWEDAIGFALPLMRSAGANRQRGNGRLTAAIEKGAR